VREMKAAMKRASLDTHLPWADDWSLEAVGAWAWDSDDSSEEFS
jgi:hypothetical protein